MTGMGPLTMIMTGRRRAGHAVQVKKRQQSRVRVWLMVGITPLTVAEMGSMNTPLTVAQTGSLHKPLTVAGMGSMNTPLAVAGVRSVNKPLTVGGVRSMNEPRSDCVSGKYCGGMGTHSSHLALLQSLLAHLHHAVSKLHPAVWAWAPSTC